MEGQGVNGLWRGFQSHNVAFLHAPKNASADPQSNCGSKQMPRLYCSRVGDALAFSDFLPWQRCKRPHKPKSMAICGREKAQVTFPDAFTCPGAATSRSTRGKVSRTHPISPQLVVQRASGPKWLDFTLNPLCQLN